MSEQSTKSFGEKAAPVRAMILAAGKETRVYTLTGEIPKPLAPVAGTPIIQHIFELLAEAGTQEVHVNVCYLADSLLAAYGETSTVQGMDVHLSREEELRGTAGGVKRLEGNFDDTFVVIMGDALTDIDVRDAVAFHKEKGALATIALKWVEDTSEYGVVELGPAGNILGFQEKPAPEEAVSNLANTGIYVFEPGVFEYIPENTFFDFAKDVFPRLLEAGESFVGYEGDFFWSDIGSLEAYREAHHALLSGQVRVRVPGERWGESLWVGEDTRIHPSAELEGRVAVGRDALIGSDASLSDDVTIGTGCRVRPDATIKRSILLPGAIVGVGAHLEDCIVGHGYQVRPGEVVKGATLSTGQPYVPQKASLSPDLPVELPVPVC